MMKLISHSIYLSTLILAACGAAEPNAQTAAKQAKIAVDPRVTMQQAAQVAATLDAQAQAQKAQIDEQTQ